MEPLISIIVAAYNAEEHLEECLESLVSQTHSNLEILVCNDCSSDRTPQILSRYAGKDARIRVISNQCNLRAAASRNRCIAQSRGAYIMVQDSDDVCERNRAERLLAELLGNKEFQFVSSGYYLFDDHGRYKEIVPGCGTPQKNDFLFSLPFCHAATMFRSDCLKAVGGYRVSKETRRGQDYDLFMRLYARGYRGENIRDILYGYRVDQAAVNRRKFRYRLDECRIRYRGFKQLGLLPRGFPYVLKPIPAYFFQLVKRR